MSDTGDVTRVGPGLPFEGDKEEESLEKKEGELRTESGGTFRVIVIPEEEEAADVEKATVVQRRTPPPKPPKPVIKNENLIYAFTIVANEKSKSIMAEVRKFGLDPIDFTPKANAIRDRTIDQYNKNPGCMKNLS